MARRFRSFLSQSPEDVPAVLRLWVLRLLVPMGGHREFLSEHGFIGEAIAEAIGLGEWLDSDGRDYDARSIRAELRKLHGAAERKHRGAPIPKNLANNVSRLKQLVGLSETDCRILEFAVLLHNERLLDQSGELIGLVTSASLFHTLSVVLDLPEAAIRASLSANGVLGKSGLVTVDRSGSSNLRGKLDLLSHNLADTIVSTDTDPIDLLRDAVVPSAPAQLALADFGYIAPTLAVLQPYLRKSIDSSRKGVNIFFHGAPGTGKNQLARALAKEFGCELFEVASEDDDGDPVPGERRLRAFRAAQSIFAQRRTMILFDEVEDVFNDGDNFFGRKSTAQTRKAWINRMLEDNAVPTLWLSNSIDSLDPAFIRRFDMLVELPVPPRKQRERILMDACADLLTAESVKRIADAEGLAPAVITRAASVIRSVSDELGRDGSSAAFELVVSSTLEAQGHPPIEKYIPQRLPELYDPAFIHSDCDLAQVASGLAETKSGRLCLYGPSGTGKTAFGRWVAERLGVPLVVKRASDLMSMWVGGNEKNIARVFHEAEQDGALLLIDEVDSFLRDRRGAHQGWEVTQVNEMLTQMESFPGVFIASTNLMGGLDQAALRRFDLKVRFDYLRPEQACELFRRHCAQIGFAPPREEILAKVRHLHCLTPGDFAAVMRQHRFRAIQSPAMLLAALEAECAVKDSAGAAIGFLA